MIFQCHGLGRGVCAYYMSSPQPRDSDFTLGADRLRHRTGFTEAPGSHSSYKE